jgi:hypothetical protein
MIKHKYMRLRSILEGFYFGLTGGSLSDYIGTDRKFKDPASIRYDISKKLAPIQLLYTDEDNPSDIIKTQSFITKKNLSGFIPQDVLPTFKNCMIYYAFANSKAEDYRGSGFNHQGNKFLEPLDEVLSLGYPPSTTASELQSFAIDSKREGDAESAGLLMDAYRSLKGMYEFFDVTSPHFENYTVGRAMLKVNSDLVNPVVVSSAYEFSKRVKNPQSIDDVRMRDKFIDLAVEEFKKMALSVDPEMLAYDYVVFPESSKHGGRKNFNQLLADKLCVVTGAVHLNVPQMVEISKLSPANIQVDYQQLYDYALANAHKAKNSSGGYVHSIKSGTTVYANATDYAKAWANNEHAKLVKLVGRDPKAFKISDIPQDKRMFVKFFDSSNVNDLSEKDVLVVDDNVVASGTIQLIHELLMKMAVPPRRVDVFVPYRIIGW